MCSYPMIRDYQMTKICIMKSFKILLAFSFVSIFLLTSCAPKYGCPGKITDVDRTIKTESSVQGHALLTECD